MKLAALLWLLMAGAGVSACRQALILALDVSGSVDETEYVLQLNGVATALDNADVRAALLSLPDAPVALAIFEWSSSGYQAMILDWTFLDTPGAIDQVSARLRSRARRPAPESTAIGAALRYAETVMARAPACWRQTLDISGDGKNNGWPVPKRVLERGALTGTTINALVIGEELLRDEPTSDGGIADLLAYFRTNIIKGPHAFVEVALGYQDYADAMTRKLLKEVAPAAIGRKPGDGSGRPAPIRLAHEAGSDQ